ncbi:unnamed protein product [Pleuronectes platessa]|uniref:Uncharacterized protein n=1 Tax=Pleuronectes platessa TaxID=8262 RepID=A0A9N7UTJ5_PLEPL|nr:unnamed protein product [Pleuronectes platessa]
MSRTDDGGRTDLRQSQQKSSMIVPSLLLLHGDRAILNEDAQSTVRHNDSHQPLAHVLWLAFVALLFWARCTIVDGLVDEQLAAQPTTTVGYHSVEMTANTRRKQSSERLFSAKIPLCVLS